MTELPAVARLAPAAMDLSRPEPNDSAARIEALWRRALMPFGPRAAICVYSEHVAAARAVLDRSGLTAMPVAAAATFQDGSTETSRVRSEIASALAGGAGKIDAVTPWRALASGDEATVRTPRDAVLGVRGGAGIADSVGC